MAERHTLEGDAEREMMRVAASVMFEVAQREMAGAYEAMRVRNDNGDALLEVYPVAGDPIRLWVTPAFVRNEGDNLRTWLERKVGDIRKALS